jgi:signal transduction histidine kinase
VFVPAKAAPRRKDAVSALADADLAQSVDALVADLISLIADRTDAAEVRRPLDALQAIPTARLELELPEHYDRIERAFAAGAADPDARIEALRERIRERHGELLRVPAFGQRIEAPRRRASMLEWLLQENVHRLERMNSELGGQAAETERLRRELSQLEGERAQLAQELARSRSLADIGMMTAGVVHDFNNLLQAIIGYASLTHDELPADDPRRSTLEQSLDAAGRAAELTRRLMDWAKREPGHAEPCDLGALTGEVLDLLAPSSPPRALLLRALAPHLPLVMADPTELRRIVLNLMMNAWQAIGERPGEVLVTTGTIEGRERRVFVEVSDDGCGMDDETRMRVFEPFYSTRDQGYGLGLPTVQRLVESLGGTIEVWSEVGRGARFRVALPAIAPGGATATA